MTDEEKEKIRTSAAEHDAYDEYQNGCGWSLVDTVAALLAEVDRLEAQWRAHEDDIRWNSLWRWRGV